MPRCFRELCMERKSQENLEAAALLAGNDTEPPSANAAVSRAYYAAYQATWAEMVHRHVPIPERDAGQYFGHKQLPDDAEAQGFWTKRTQTDCVSLKASV